MICGRELDMNLREHCTCPHCLPFWAPPAVPPDPPLTLHDPGLQLHVRYKLHGDGRQTFIAIDMRPPRRRRR